MLKRNKDKTAGLGFEWPMLHRNQLNLGQISIRFYTY